MLSGNGQAGPLFEVVDAGLVNYGVVTVSRNLERTNEMTDLK